MIAKKMMKHLLIILLWTSISFGQGYQERKNEFKRSLSNIIVELSAGNGYFIGTFYDLENEKTDTLQISDYPITYKDALKARKDCNNHILKLLAENNYESVLDYEGKKLLAYNELCRLFKDGKALGLIAKIRQNELIAANSNIKNTAHIKNRPQPQNLRKGGFNFFFGFPKAQFGFSIFTLRKSKLGIYGDLRIGIPIRGSSDNPNYYDFISESTFNDPQIGKHWDRVGGNIGITLTLSNNFFAYIGGGLEYRELFVELDDPTDILGDRRGHYWVKAEKSETVPNFVVGGVLFQNSPLGIHIGFHTVNIGIDAGIAYSFQ